nr:hypothetical protein [Tanacetum cinerariifolium]
MQKKKNGVKARTTLLLSLPDEHQLRFTKHSSGNEDGNTACVPTASTNVPIASASVATISQDTACAYIASQSSGFQIKLEDINQIGKKISIHGSDVAGFDKSKVECFNCHKMGHFARECMAPRSQDRGRRDNFRQGSKAKEHALKALMAIDGVGWDWSYMANDGEEHALVADEEAPTEFALMANTSTESKTLKQEKEGVNGKLAGLLTASKDLDNLIESQRSDKNKEGLGYTAVPPPLVQLYLSPKKDLSWTGLPECADDTITDYSRPSPTVENSQSESKSDKKETPKKPLVKYAEQYRKPNKKPNAHSYANRPIHRTLAMRSPYRAPWVPSVNRNYPSVNRKFSTGSRNFPTANRKFPTASRKFPTGSSKSPNADMGKKGKATLQPQPQQVVKLKRTWKKISIKGSDVAGFDKSKVECFNCHKMGHFARECRALKSQDRGRRDNFRQGSKAEEQAPKALMAIDEVGWDWSYMENDGGDHALKNNDSLNSKIPDLTDKLFDAKNMIYHYKLALAQVESRLVEYKEREVKYIEKIRTLEFYNESNKECIETLKKKLETLKQEKEGVNGKLAGLLTASKDLDNLIESQRSECADDTVTDYSRPSPTVESPDFVMKKKACFNCGNYNHLAYDCRKRVKKNFTPRPVAHRPYRPSQNNFTPRPVTHRPYRPSQRPVKTMRSPYRAPWVPSVNMNYPSVNRKFSTGSRNFPTANRNFPLLVENFPLVAQKVSLLIWKRREKLAVPRTKLMTKAIGTVAALGT